MVSALALLQHRNCRILPIDTRYPDLGSAHALDVATHELMATTDDVAAVLAALESDWNAEEIVRSGETLYQV